jgi:hypothetical protein
MYDSKEYIDKIEKKYYREIELTVKRMYEFNKRLSFDELMDTQYSLNPRNKVEMALKEDIMASIRQRNLEGFRPEEARAIALICGNKSLALFKEIIIKERSKKR